MGKTRKCASKEKKNTKNDFFPCRCTLKRVQSSPAARVTGKLVQKVTRKTRRGAKKKSILLAGAHESEQNQYSRGGVRGVERYSASLCISSRLRGIKLGASPPPSLPVSTFSPATKTHLQRQRHTYARALTVRATTSYSTCSPSSSQRPRCFPTLSVTPDLRRCAAPRRWSASRP